MELGWYKRYNDLVVLVGLDLGDGLVDLVELPVGAPLYSDPHFLAGIKVYLEHLKK